MKLVLVALIIVSVLAIGIAGFSIYLQQGKAIMEISKATNPNYSCLEKWDALNGKAKLTSPQRLTDTEQEIFNEFNMANCQFKFRDWLPQSHIDWDYYVELESYLKSTCDKMTPQDIAKQDKETLEYLKNIGCNIGK
ncbi:MAG: hypothetical protein KC444_07885 [Nitrosopumilus sp.]|nr:hypothetical protein [Nitrosopumilus sp.]